MAVCFTKNCDFEYKALYEYIEIGDEDKLRNFLNQFTDDEQISILTTPFNGFNCFHLCCNNGNLKLLLYILDIEYIKQKREYLVDILNMQTKDGDTCLLISCSKGYDELATYLILCGADVNKQNNFGRSALHYCAMTCNLEVFKLLIQYNARKESEDALGSTPVFVAAYHGNSSIVEFIINSNLSTRLEAIAIYEILGCALAQLLKFNEAVLFWRKALVYRHNQSKEPKSKNIINLKSNVSHIVEKEFETEEELEIISSDQNLIILQSIAIMERYYGSNHLITLKYLSESAFYFQRKEEYDLSLLLMIEKIKNQNCSRLIGFLNTYDSFHKLLELLMRRKHKSYSNNFFMVFDLFSKQLKENVAYMSGKYRLKSNLKEFDDTLVLLSCYIIFFTHEIKNGNINNDNIFKIKSIIYELLKCNLKCLITGYPILHLTLSTKLEHIDSGINIDVLKLLFECGAKPMEFDCCKNTILHTVIGMPVDSKTNRLEMIKYLLDNGAHLDARNMDFQISTDFLNENELPRQILYSFINPLKYLSLKCFAAQVIKKHKISYSDDSLPESLVEFLSYH